MNAPAVLLINAMGTGGAERAVALAAKRLRDRGRDLRLVCLERVGTEDAVEVEEPIAYLSDMPAASGAARKFAALPLLAYRLAAFVRSEGASVVMSHLFRANFVNALAHSAFGSPHRTILVNHTRIGRLRGEGISGKVNGALCRFLYPRADIVASVSRGAAEECRGLLGLDPGRSVTLYNPVDTGAASAAAACGESVEAIVAVGRLVALKRFGDLIAAFSGIAAEFPSLELRIVGEGPERERLEAAASATGFRERIIFFGRLADPYPIMAGCRAFVSCSETEGFGISLVEALSIGVPVISSDCAFGPREILAPDSDQNRMLESGESSELAEFGFLYPVGDVSALEATLRRALADDGLRAVLAGKGKTRAGDYSVDKAVDAYEGLLYYGETKKFS